MWKVVLPEYSLFILLTKLYSKKKTASPSPSGFLKISSFPAERVNLGKGLPYFFFPEEGCLQDEKEMNYSKELK
jgi:hypothetical protein